MVERIGRYEVNETLGKGGMGVVYRARDPELDREVAIKVVLSWAQFDPDAMARFNREARVVASLRHPNIVTIFDAGRTEDGMPYFVMEYLEGTDLGAVLAREGTLPAERAIDYVLQVCAGLTYAHEREIVHRDIKPANLRVLPDDHLKIVDFGIAMLVGARITGSGVSLGTPLYMAPEQVAGRTVDRRADVFAAGGVLYTMLAGQSPFEAPTLGAICHKIESEDPPPLSQLGVSVPPQLEATIERALQKDPEQRYPDAAALAADLREALDAVESGTAPTVVTPRSAPAAPGARTEPVETRTRRRAALAVALIGLMVAATLWAWPRFGESVGGESVSGESVGGESVSGESVGGEPVSGESMGGESVDGGGAGEGVAKMDAREREAGGRPPSTEEPKTRSEPGAGRRADPAAEPPLPTNRPHTVYSASAIEWDQANRLLGQLMRGLQGRDTAAIARAFGGTVPPRARAFLRRLLNGPRVRIRYNLEEVGRVEDGTVLARVRHDLLFVGQPGKVPPPRTGVWTAVFRPDEYGQLRLVGLRPR